MLVVVFTTIWFRFSNEKRIPSDVLARPGSGEWPPLRMANWVLKKFAILTPIAVALVVDGEKTHVPFSHALVDLFVCEQRRRD